MEQEHPLDQKVNRIAKKLSKLQADYENLAHDNTMLHVGVSHLAIKQQVRLAELPHSELALKLISCTSFSPNNQVKLRANTSRWSISTEIVL